MRIVAQLGYGHQLADYRLGDPPPRCTQEPFVVNGMMKDPKRTAW